MTDVTPPPVARHAYDGAMARKPPVIRKPRGTNTEVIQLWADDWLGDLPEKQSHTIARTLCHRLGIDPEAKAVAS